MLEIRPSCENCNCELGANSIDAMICSFECTYCKSCVENVLHNVCPNCGGGFYERPIRPVTNLIGENYLGKYPASIKQIVNPVNITVHEVFSDAIRTIAPKKR